VFVHHMGYNTFDSDINHRQRQIKEQLQISVWLIQSLIS
jgi:hypothetical protein